MTHLRLVGQDAPMSNHDDVEPITLLPDYTTWLRSWGAAESTIKVRTSVLARALGEAGSTRDALTAWLANYRDPWTRSAYFSHLVSFYGWAHETGRISVNPMHGMRRPRAPKATPRPLSDDQIRAVLEVATGRTLAYVLLGTLAGLRAHEMAKVRGEDVTAQVFHVLGKGGQSAYVPTHPRLWELAQEYPRRGWWFPSPSRPDRPVTASAVSAAVTKVFARLGIEGSSHRLRHTYGTALLASGANLRTVQELMRHESVTSTQIYTRVTDEERRAAVLRLVA